MNRLATQSFGEGGRPLLVAHGLFGTGRNWGVIAKRLSDRGRVVTVDMRNHGDSFWDDDHSYKAMAGDLAEIIGEEEWDVLGHSMGGKASMALALHHPEKVRRLVVADIAPVAYSHSQMQFIHAMRALDLSQISTRKEADDAFAVHVHDAGVRAFLLQSLDVREGRWRMNLDVLEARMEEITGWQPIDATFPRAAMFLSGGDSDYVKSEYSDDIRALFPKARFVWIPGTGHWLHAEKPRDVEASIRLFLDA
ncbi:alpha/beta fold hydrolase [Palleronia sp. LCG004]|uniref:alpha/beta fold hydrolase n=1 Tax=Palleronia sp. LCG004 TaxID=3079304 RepID=UPI002941D3B2|nr:alpha/beta fold hydrolase [Palleronia sp. LCG004]WOI56962.1 alpha/beta fold hydrolase [Palleronia sp. LCG004]